MGKVTATGYYLGIVIIEYWRSGKHIFFQYIVDNIQNSAIPCDDIIACFPFLLTKTTICNILKGAILRQQTQTKKWSPLTN